MEHTVWEFPFNRYDRAILADRLAHLHQHGYALEVALDHNAVSDCLDGSDVTDRWFLCPLGDDYEVAFDRSVWTGEWSPLGFLRTTHPERRQFPTRDGFMRACADFRLSQIVRERRRPHVFSPTSTPVDDSPNRWSIDSATYDQEKIVVTVDDECNLISTEYQPSQAPWLR